jgi:hypothetical protein
MNLIHYHLINPTFLIHPTFITNLQCFMILNCLNDLINPFHFYFINNSTLLLNFVIISIELSE